MINQEVKGTLARLLATENLTVEHRQVTTAYFDVEKRVLCLPIWKSASNTVYDLLVGHEVGHALYTPADDWGDTPKAFINVLEDARIEKLMKRTYPGLRKSFFDGYKELWDQDFFGVKHEDHDHLSLIDRINLYFKGNSSIPFSDEEKVWVDRTGKTETFQEVKDLAHDLYEWAKEKQAQNEEAFDKENEVEFELDGNGNMGGGGSSQEIDATENSQDSSSLNPISEDSDEGGQEDGISETKTQSGNLGSETGSLDHTGGDRYDTDLPADETESITERALAEALEDLVDDDAKEWVYLNLPKVNVNKLTIPYTEIQSDLEGFFNKTEEEEANEKYKRDNLRYMDGRYESFKKDAQKSVNYLVKQFEMRKSADQYKRAAVSKTGVINTNTLYKYKLTDDIFKKVTTIPDGKNHGLILHLDWSGSMQYQLLDTLKQVFNLVWFCRKAGIPFRVYAFQSAYMGAYRDKDLNPGTDPKVNDLGIGGDFRLLELLSSRQNAKSLERSCKMIFRQVFCMGGYRVYAMDKYTLGGTPLAEAVICTRQLVRDLKKQESVQKVNVVCLTDGESNPMSYWTKTNYSSYDYEFQDEFRLTSMGYARGRVFILRDHETGYQRKLNSSPYETTKEIVSYMREVTDYNWIGIRLCSKSELGRVVRMLGLEQQRSDALDKQWKKERFASIKNEIGFSEAFYMPDKGNGEGTQDLEVKQKGEVATKAELQRAFKKHMGSKTTNKTLLNAFIEQIA